jgi:parallel beta-helix repeat protein
MAATITVNSTDDSNTRNAVLTLREAILIANGTLNLPTLTAAEQAQINGNVGTGVDRDTIAFNIGAIGSQQLIQPLSALPQISDRVIIDGLSQGGAGYNGLPLVELSGPGISMVGLDITAGNSIVRGLAINRFDLAGIRLQTNGSNEIASNHIGTDLAGTIDRANRRGIWIDGVPDNRIENNLISGNNTVGVGLGIEISGIAARNNQIIRNRIGTDVTGKVAQLRWHQHPQCA